MVRDNIGKKVSYFGSQTLNERASERASDRPSAPQAYQCKITESTGMATQLQLKVLFGRKSHDRPDF